MSFDDGRRRRRFPALVVETAGGRRAVELELYFKPRKRMQAIVESAGYSDVFEEAVWLVATSSQKARIQQLLRRTRPPSWLRPTPLAVHCLAERSVDEIAGMLAAPVDRLSTGKNARTSRGSADS